MGQNWLHVLTDCYPLYSGRDMLRGRLRGKVSKTFTTRMHIWSEPGHSHMSYREQATTCHIGNFQVVGNDLGGHEARMPLMQGVHAALQAYIGDMQASIPPKPRPANAIDPAHEQQHEGH